MLLLLRTDVNCAFITPVTHTVLHGVTLLHTVSITDKLKAPFMPVLSKPPPLSFHL